MSVRQTAQALTRTSNYPLRGFGFGTSRSSNGPFSSLRTMARIVTLPLPLSLALRRSGLPARARVTLNERPLVRVAPVRAVAQLRVRGSGRYGGKAPYRARAPETIRPRDKS